MFSSFSPYVQALISSRGAFWAFTEPMCVCVCVTIILFAWQLNAKTFNKIQTDGVLIAGATADVTLLRAFEKLSILLLLRAHN